MNIPTFTNQQLFEQVFTHRSYLNESKIPLESNERLEFLGDSILSFIVSSYIFEHFPDFKEGELTNLRSILTNTETLASVSRELGLGTHLKLSKGEEAGGGRENKTLLANTFEALLGGLFVDQGIEAGRAFVQETILSRTEKFLNEYGLKDPKSQLQETIQELHKVSPIYKIISEEGPDHAKLYTVGVYLNETLLAEGVGQDPDCK
jgi:ribonuclease-3